MIIPNIWENKKATKPPTSVMYGYVTTVKGVPTTSQLLGVCKHGCTHILLCNFKCAKKPSTACLHHPNLVALITIWKNP